MNNKLFCTLLFTGLVVFSVSCKKNPAADKPDSYIKIKKNGTWKTYSKAAGDLGPDLINAAKTDFDVTAYTEDLSENFDITVQVDGSNFTAGTYTNNSPDYYFDVTFTTGYNTSDIHRFSIQNGIADEECKYTLHVTSITPTYLSGSFTGNYLYDDFASDSGIVRITEGEFRVKRLR
jgi:hypothetical protein